MNWRIGMALTFLLILLFAILHMAMRVIPPVHTSADQEDKEVGVTANPLTAIPSHWSSIQEGESVRIYPTGMQFDSSGNVLYPFGAVSYP